jgi:hypothetical protein
MRSLRCAALWLAMGVAVGACRSGRAGAAQPQAGDRSAAGAMVMGGMIASAGPGTAGTPSATSEAGTAGPGGGNHAGAAGTMVAGCADTEAITALGIASAPLNAAPPLKLSAAVQLLGDGLASTLMPQQLGQAGLRRQGDRTYLLTDGGFWDVPDAGPGRWYPTSTVGVLGVRAADLDADGDQDLMLLSMQINSEVSSATSMPFVSRLTVWERTVDGLIERSELTHFAGFVLPLPYVFGDVDGDADLDVVGYEQGAPVGYINGGSFKFTRTVLGEASADYKDKLVGLVDYADRNQDGSPDLLVLAGEALDVRGFVLRGDGKGKFGAPGHPTSLISALAPHGPTGTGFGAADVTGDGLADVLVQDPQGTASAPILRLFASIDATTLAPSIELKALGFEFADVDADGKTDIVTTLADRLFVLLSRNNGKFEPRELGVDMAAPAVLDFVVDPGQRNVPPAVRVLYGLRACPMCDAACGGHCLFATCVGCLSDADCGAGRCAALGCMPPG